MSAGYAQEIVSAGYALGIVSAGYALTSPRLLQSHPIEWHDMKIAGAVSEVLCVRRELNQCTSSWQNLIEKDRHMKVPQKL